MDEYEEAQAQAYELIRMGIPVATPIFEKVLGAMPPGTPIPIPIEEARELVRSGRYRPHGGLGRAWHWRAPRGKGCYHLRIFGNKTADLHWDQWDPIRYPVRHALEVMRKKPKKPT